MARRGEAGGLACKAARRRWRRRVVLAGLQGAQGGRMVRPLHRACHDQRTEYTPFGARLSEAIRLALQTG